MGPDEWARGRRGRATWCANGQNQAPARRFIVVRNQSAQGRFSAKNVSSRGRHMVALNGSGMEWMLGRREAGGKFASCRWTCPSGVGFAGLILAAGILAAPVLLGLFKNMPMSHWGQHTGDNTLGTIHWNEQWCVTKKKIVRSWKATFEKKNVRECDKSVDIVHLQRPLSRRPSYF